VGKAHGLLDRILVTASPILLRDKPGLLIHS
jgi:hypothetical protein